MKVACFSVAAMDYFPQQDKRYAGGNALNQAIRFRQMGHSSAFVGAVGTDEAGDRLVTLLQAESVDVSHLRRIDGHTAHNRIMNDDSGERYGSKVRGREASMSNLNWMRRIGPTSIGSMCGQRMPTAPII